MIKEYIIEKTHFLPKNHSHKGSIYLVRHGETDLNAKGVLQGSLEAPLNARGKQQALHSGQLLEGLGITKIVSSPQIRARETAEIISKHLNITIEENALLRERDWGIYEGKFRDERDDTGEGVEPREKLNARALRAYIDITSNLTSPCAIVTHSGLIKTLLMQLTGSAPSEIQNGEIIKICF